MPRLAILRPLFKVIFLFRYTSQKSLPLKRRFVPLLLAVVSTLLVSVFAFASPLAAHAFVTSSFPGDGERLESSPREVVFSFNEPVSVSLGGVAVFDRFGVRHDTGVVSQPARSVVRADIAGTLAAGSYLASYRVVSSDGHVVSGASLFSVASELDSGVLRDVGSRSNRVFEVAQIFSSFAVYVGALFAVGLVLFANLLARDPALASRVTRFVRVAVVLAFCGAAATVAVRAAEATGLGFLSVFRGDVALALLRQGGLGLWLAFFSTGLVLLSLSPRFRVASAFGLVGSFLVAGSFVFTGHSVGSPIGVAISTFIHFVVAALWLGGLFGVFVVVKDESRSPVRDVGVVSGLVGRFSVVAASAVLLLWVSGVVQAWWNLGGVTAFFNTRYGQVLALKLLVVVFVLLLAAWNKFRLLPRLQESSRGFDSNEGVFEGFNSRQPFARFLRVLRVELLLLVVVVAVTSMLVGLVPARLGSPGTFDVSLPVTSQLEVNLFVTPTTAGFSELHVTFFEPSGLVASEVLDVSVEVSLPDLKIGPMTVPLDILDGGHFFGLTESLAISGVWDVVVVSRLDDFVVERTRFEVPIQP